MAFYFRCLVALPVDAEDMRLLLGLVPYQARERHGHDGRTVLLYGYRGRPAARNAFVQDNV